MLYLSRLFVFAGLCLIATGCVSPDPGGKAGSASQPPGSTDAGWATHCPTKSTYACVPGTWTAIEPTPQTDPPMPPIKQETAHFALRYVAPVDDANAKAVGDLLETAWANHVGPVGFREPFCESATKHKVNVHLDPKFYATGSGTGDWDPAMWISPQFGAGGGDNMEVLAHELTHCMQFNSGGFRATGGYDAVGWFWESHAEFNAHTLPETHNLANISANRAINGAHLGFGHESTRYNGFYFLEFLADRYCYQAVDELWTTAKQLADAGTPPHDVVSVLQATRQWSVDQVNDFFGDFAMHTVAMDFRDLDGTDHGDYWRGQMGPRVSQFGHSGEDWLRDVRLDVIDAAARRFAVPMGWAPQPRGFNIARLVPDSGAQSVTVDFRGIVQETPAVSQFSPAPMEPNSVSNPNSDWRWGLVATDSTGANPRYSALQHGAAASLTFAVQPNEQLYLVVAGTPTSVEPLAWNQAYFTVYRYPWMVQLQGAYPAGYGPDGDTANASYSRWPNGGGLVNKAAKVDASVYVGPQAVVYGGTATGNARIDGHALMFSGTLSDNAQLDNLSVLRAVTLNANARMSTTAAPVGGDAGQTFGGSCMLLGDMDMYLTPAKYVTEGVYYGYEDVTTLADPNNGHARTAPAPEVTATPDFTWR